MSDDSSSSYSSGEEDEFRDDMRVFLRLRPINKLEQSRRSKNCIELHEDPTLVTVDSPLEGEYDYTFDHVSINRVLHHILEISNILVLKFDDFLIFERWFLTQLQSMCRFVW
jgi:hypothetical protein